MLGQHNQNECFACLWNKALELSSLSFHPLQSWSSAFGEILWAQENQGSEHTKIWAKTETCGPTEIFASALIFSLVDMWQHMYAACSSVMDATLESACTSPGGKLPTAYQWLDCCRATAATRILNQKHIKEICPIMQRLCNNRRKIGKPLLLILALCLAAKIEKSFSLAEFDYCYLVEKFPVSKSCCLCHNIQNIRKI